MLGNLWWVFVLIGIFLMVMEVYTSGFVIMWFGISFIITAIPVYFNAPTQIIVLTFSLTLLVLTIFIRKIAINLFSKSSRNVQTNVAGIIGQKGIVVEEINPINSTGRVRIRKELWTATSESDEIIPKNTQTVVLRIEGVKLIVKRSL